MEASLRVVREGPDGLAKREAAHWITVVKGAWAKQGAMRSAVKDWLWRMGRNTQQRVAELTYDRVYTSPAGVRTACKLLSVRQGAAHVQFIDGVASVKAQSLTHRQCDGEMGARKEGMHARERAEAAAKMQAQAEKEAAVRKKRIELERRRAGAATLRQQTADREAKEGEQAVNQAVAAGRILEAQEMKRQQKLAVLVDKWKALDIGSIRNSRKAVGTVRCLAEETARVAGVTMAQAVQAVTGGTVVNWHHGVQMLKCAMGGVAIK